ncbi:NAD(P)H-dependent oxidoreductase subunit E [Candidatus Fermentibacteria bacterium]|nr:NAD(P)H-dependent oxidoreductase subunit E [Candidatus Fermentibacteria bacterium]
MAKTPEQVVAEAADRTGRSPDSVLRLLQEVNREFGYVPHEAIRAVSRITGKSAAHVRGVATFYSFLSSKPRGRHIVRLCSTVSCEMKGSSEVLKALEKELGICAGNTTPDGRVTLETTSCLGLCDKSPAMLVNDVPYSGLTPETACEIVRGLR